MGEATYRSRFRAWARARVEALICAPPRHAILPHAAILRQSALLVALAGPLLAGCQRSPAPDVSTEPTPSVPEPPPASPPTPTPELDWRTLAPLQEHLGADANVVPLLEVRDELRGSARAIFAIHRRGAEPPLSVELWRFRVRTPLELIPTGDPEPVLRLRREDPPSSALPELRLFAATPGNTMIRPRGFASSPDELIRELAAAVAAYNDPEATGDARAWALAQVIRGLDDSMVLERDAVHRVLRVFSEREPAITRREELSSRRIRVEIAGATGPRVLDVMHLREGWVIADIRIAAEADDAPAPAPGDAPSEAPPQGASGSIEPAAEPSPTAP
ncbi:MAG: hypothetical protein KC420_02330 [Myxococcales bacterium]|nr:hypothetical protein [Myxococcales bacterium]MCB9568383.1 hypothetical protein [Myxococcales bacterium]MCB9705107.1 hypothetical protein [Myxococcales bacterium]